MRVLACIGFSFLAGCTAQEGGPAPLALNDQQLETAVERELTSDPSIPANEIIVAADASEREVTLSGVLMSHEHRARAVELAQRAEADLVVIDKLDVVPAAAAREEYTSEMEQETRTSAEHLGMKIGQSIDDAFIYASVVAKLSVHETLSMRDIGVDVENKEVTLRGEVASTEAKAEAERLARETNGVEEVENQITVGAGA